MDANYSSDFQFTSNDSPYYIDNEVTFLSDVLIQNGVEIIFNGDYSLIFKGDINCGCYDTNTQDRNDIFGLIDFKTV